MTEDDREVLRRRILAAASYRLAERDLELPLLANASILAKQASTSARHSSCSAAVTNAPPALLSPKHPGE